VFYAEYRDAFYNFVNAPKRKEFRGSALKHLPLAHRPYIISSCYTSLPSVVVYISLSSLVILLNAVVDVITQVQPLLRRSSMARFILTNGK
jgi:hypothetical protein